MEGLLLVDKPAQWTSFDVVNYVRRMVAQIEDKKPRNVKVGHTGTLDPAATGLLVLCVGKNYTKKVPELIKQDKTYEVELTLGKSSTTGDKEGEILNVNNKQPSIDKINSVISEFVGEIEQTPPIYSAIKINGKRAYDLARAGKEVEMKARKVVIHSINNVTYNYPFVRFETRVGSGTYIRSLAVDIGEKLGTGAYMSNLRRTSIGDDLITNAYPVKDISPEILQKALDYNR
jgi:tRNA pseudouridine55 synthase